MDLVNYICIKQLFFIYLPMEQSSDGSLRPAQRLMGEIKCMKTRCSLGTVVNSQVPDRNKETHYEIRNYDTTKGGCCWWRECLEVLPLSKVYKWLNERWKRQVEWIYLQSGIVQTKRLERDWEMSGDEHVSERCSAVQRSSNNWMLMIS